MILFCLVLFSLMKRFVMVLRFESRDCPFRSVIVGVQ